MVSGGLVKEFYLGSTNGLPIKFFHHPETLPSGLRELE
jgi:hypothetical protein